MVDPILNASGSIVSIGLSDNILERQQKIKEADSYKKILKFVEQLVSI